MRSDGPVERWQADNLLELPFDQYQRQRQSAQIVEALREPGQTFSILDVGGGGAAVRPFLDPGDLVVSVDPSPARSLESIRGHGAFLPLADASFDFTLALDTLEHVQPKVRLRLTDECVRVAKTGVILIGPLASPEAAAAENLLFEFIRCTLGAEHEQLREHLVNGLPDQALIEAHLQSLGYPYFARPSGYIHRWLAMMLLKHFLMSLPDSGLVHRRLDRYYNRYFFEADQCPPSYRSVLFIAKNGSGDALEKASRALATTDAGGGSDASVGSRNQRFEQLADLAHLDLLVNLASLQATNARSGGVGGQAPDVSSGAPRVGGGNIRQTLAEMEAQLRQRDLELAAARDLLDGIARGKVMRLMSALHSLRRKRES